MKHARIFGIDAQGLPDLDTFSNDVYNQVQQQLENGCKDIFF